MNVKPPLLIIIASIIISIVYHYTVGLNYFTSHYYLGSKKFETADTENFLYGDLPDINYMTNIPCPVSQLTTQVHISIIIYNS